MHQLQLENEKYRHMAAALNYLPQVLEEVQSTGSAVNRFLDNFPHYTLHTSVSDSQAMPDDTHNPSLK